MSIYYPAYHIRNIKTNEILRKPDNPYFELSFKSKYDIDKNKRTNGITLAKRYLNNLPNKEDYVIEKYMVLVC